MNTEIDIATIETEARRAERARILHIIAAGVRLGMEDEAHRFAFNTPAPARDAVAYLERLHQSKEAHDDHA